MKLNKKKSYIIDIGRFAQIELIVVLLDRREDIRYQS